MQHSDTEDRLHGSRSYTAEAGLQSASRSLAVHSIVGSRLDPPIAEALHRLAHRNALEFVHIAPADLARHRLRVVGDLGTEYRIALPRRTDLYDGAVLLLAADRAAVLRVEAGQKWLRLRPVSLADAVELGYHAGNLHWRVRFQGGDLLVALEAAESEYTARVASLIDSARVKVVDEPEAAA